MSTLLEVFYLVKLLKLNTTKINEKRNATSLRRSSSIHWRGRHSFVTNSTKY